MEILDSDGISWKKVGPFALPDGKFGAIEPALFFDKEGNLRMVCRDRAKSIGGTGYIWQAISRDGGVSWSPFVQTALPNPDSGIDVADLGEGRVMLFYNHSHVERRPLNFAISRDGGDSWSEPYLLDEVGEFPSAIVASSGLVHVTYSRPLSDAPGAQRGTQYVAIDPKTFFD